MDQTTIRLILLTLGSLLVAGIYLWDRYKRSIRSPRRFAQPAKTKQTAHKPFEKKQPKPDKVRNEPFIDNAGPTADLATTVPATGMPEQTQASAQKDQLPLDLGDTHNKAILLDPDLRKKAPQLILQLHIVARTEPFNATQIKATANIVGLQYGEMQIFHRQSDLPGKPLFSLANMLEPGILPLENTPEFSTPGLSLFAQLPGAQEGEAIYTEMLFTAQRLADLLQADLHDATHSPLTKQAIEHTRDTIQEHQRQIKLLTGC